MSERTLSHGFEWGRRGKGGRPPIGGERGRRGEGRGPCRAIYRHLRSDKATKFVTPRNFIPTGINFDLSSANDLIGLYRPDRRAAKL